MDDCSYCGGVRLVGWSGAGPILCPTCSSGADAFTVITHAWREQRKRAIEAENERDRLRSALEVYTAENARLAQELAAAQIRIAELEESASMACECPPSGCDCAGCRYANEKHGVKR